MSGSKVWGERTSTWMNANLSFTLRERFIRKHYITFLCVYVTCSKKLIKIFTGGGVKIKMTQVLVVMHQSFWGSLQKIEHFFVCVHVLYMKYIGTRGLVNIAHHVRYIDGPGDRRVLIKIWKKTGEVEV